MGSLILDAVVSIVARLAIMLVLMLLLTVAGLLAMVFGAIFFVIGQIWPPVNPPYIGFSTSPQILTVTPEAVLFGQPVGILALTLHGVMTTLAYSYSRIGGMSDRLLRAAVSILLSPISLAITIVIANVVIAVVSGMAAPARAFIEGSQLVLTQISGLLFSMIELTSVLLVANVVPYIDAFSAGLAILLYCVQFVLMGLLVVAHRIFSALFSALLGATVIVGFISAPVEEAEDEELRGFADIAESIIRSSPVGVVLRWALTLSLALGIVGNLLVSSQQQVLNAFYATARAAAGTNYGLLKASGSRGVSVFQEVFRNLGWQAPEPCALSGAAERSCAGLLAQAAFRGFITLFIAAFVLLVIAKAMTHAALEFRGAARVTWGRAREGVRRFWGRMPGWLQQGGEQASASVLGAWRWISGGKRQEVMG